MIKNIFKPNFILFLTLYCFTEFIQAQTSLLANNMPLHNDNNTNLFSGNYSRSLFKITNGQLYACGDNLAGQLGDNSKTNRNSFIKIGNDNDWMSISNCGESTFGLKTDGSLWAWGKGNFGDGTFTNEQLTPKRIGVELWKQIQCGDLFGIGIKHDGTLWSWGLNFYGQLGLGTNTSVLNSTQIGTDSNWIQISIGNYSCVALKNNGTIWGWGYNFSGQLGLGNTNNQNLPQQIGSDNNWVKISCGQDHTIGLKSDGTIWSWGNNFLGQLGRTTSGTNSSNLQQIGTKTDWKNIYTGGNHTIALKSNGTIWTCGANSSGQLGIGNNTNQTSLVKIGTENNWEFVIGGRISTYFIKSNGVIYSCGNNLSGQLAIGNNTSSNTLNSIGTNENWKTISAGLDFSAMIKYDGTLWTWGKNSSGQLGHGNLTDSLVPGQVGSDNNWIAVATGDHHVVALKSNGRLYSWGYNSSGQLGIGNTTSQLSPVQIGTDSTWASITCGAGHTLALKTNGRLFAWGYGYTSSPAVLGSANTWVSVSGGEAHSAGIQADGSLWTWGDNSYGALGQGNYTNLNTPTRVGTANDWSRISCGANHTMALKNNGTMWGCGYNANGQLGDNSYTTQTSMVKVGSSIKWKNVCAGGFFTYSQSEDGTLYSWGRNQDGELGQGSFMNSGNITQISPYTKHHLISANRYHALVMKQDRKSFCATGLNSGGQLGDNSLTNKSSFKCHYEPIFKLKGNNIEIANNDTTPSLNDSTDFGKSKNSITRKYKIFNLGTNDLNLFNAISDGDNAGDFSLVNFPSVVKPNDSATFKVVFSTTSIGKKSTLIYIENDDYNVSNYAYKLKAEKLFTCNFSAELPTSTGTYVSNQSDLDGNYTCYCDNNNKLLLALDLNGSGAVVQNNAVSLQIGNYKTIKFNQGGGIITNPDGGVIMNRKWNVSPSVQPSNPVKVKYFFTQEENDSLVLELNNVGTVINHPSEFQMYKLFNGVFSNPNDNSATGIILMNGNLATTNDWVYSSFGSNHCAEFLVSSFSGGGGGGGGGGIPLPFDFLNFTAKGINQTSSLLKWQIAADVNVKYFEIERSFDGINFIKIGIVNGNGSTAGNYKYIDNTISTGTTKAFYRIKQIDVNGTSKSTNIQLVNFNINNSNILIYPNPLTSELNIELENVQGETVNITVTDMMGKTVYQRVASSSKTILDLSALSNGVYTISIQQNNVVENYKIVKQ